VNARVAVIMIVILTQVCTHVGVGPKLGEDGGSNKCRRMSVCVDIHRYNSMKCSNGEGVSSAGMHRYT